MYPIFPINGAFLMTVSRTVAAVLCATVVTGDIAVSDESQSADAASFARVEKVLQAKCVRCHGTATRKAELDLSSMQSLLRGGESGPSISFEDSDEGLLAEYVADGVMPPEGEGELSETEAELIVSWVDAVKRRGAPDNRSRKLNQHDVLPILLLRCTACHGRTDPKAGLDLRTRTGILRGGESGPALVPGDPANSLILKRIHASEMPPRKDLVNAAVKPMTPHEVRVLTDWIAAGAPEADIQVDVMTTEPDPLVTDEDRDFWAFRSPMKPDIPAVQDSERIRTPVDAFVIRKLEDRGLSLSPPADRVTLIRRATLDLLGLPPTPQEVDAFIDDTGADAWSRLIDRLLSSQHYGERWGQHWLDSAGYSDSEGVQHADPIRKQAWRYRDYVIRAFNSDKPYDRFLHEQLAGDELVDYESAPQITPEIYDNLVATGFLRMAPDGTFSTLTGFVPDRLELIDDELEILSSTVMGLTIKCARCHSHKFDPIPQRDYYRLAAIFKGALDEHDWLMPGARQLPFVLSSEVDAWKAAGAQDKEKPQIRALWDRGEPSPMWLLKRGNYLTTGRPIGPGVPSVLTDGRTPFDCQPPWPDSVKTGRRLAFARWLTKPDHPLTARVMVNRIWKHHFGKGIVSSLDNFGKMGARPSHPQLLDWLAVRFVESGWSIKSVHRLIMLSALYRQSSAVSPALLQQDPENSYLSRMPMRRMEGEVVRDALLAISERLDHTPGGPADNVTRRDDGLVTSQRYGDTDNWRRSVYLVKRRTQPVSILSTFDVSRMDPNCVERSESIVAPQALHLKNNKWVYQLAGSLAERVHAGVGADAAEQVQFTWRLVAGRRPTEMEMQVSMNALQRLREQWQQEHPGTRHELTPANDLWIRESEPERVFEDDLVSVWSAASGDKARRWGLIEFDASSLHGLRLTRAELHLSAQRDGAIRQQAELISDGIAEYNWHRYHEDKPSNATALLGLGRYDISDAENRPGHYTKCNGATMEDLRHIEKAIDQRGRVALVLKPADNDAAYEMDWDDGVHKTSRGRAPRLVIYDETPDPEAAHRQALHEFCHGMVNSAAFLYID